MRAGDADEDVDAGLFVFDALKVISSRSGRGGKAGAVSEEREFFEASGIHVGEKQPAIPANLRLDNSFDGLEMFH